MDEAQVRTSIQKYVHPRIYTCRETAVYEATSAETSYSDNCYYRVTGLIKASNIKGDEINLPKCVRARFLPTVPRICAMIVRSRVLPLLYSRRLSSPNPVLHEMENFGSCEIATLLRQTFRMKLLPLAVKKTQVIMREGTVTKSSQKRAEKLWTFQMLNSAESEGPPAFNNIYNERNPRRRFKRK